MKPGLLILCLFAYGISKAQVNFVRNPSFEEFTQCPFFVDQIKYANYWSAIDTVSSDPICSPEYCNVCGSGIVAVPNSEKFYQYPHTGNGLAQVQMFFDESYVEPNSYLRDNLQGKLLQPLQDGKSYCVAFYVSLADESSYAINHIGAYIDNGIIDTTDSCSLPQTQYTPQIVSQTIINDTQHWVKIEGSFISNGGEKFITIGNFYDLTHTSTINIKPINNEHVTWYLIDDVSVIESELPADAGDDRAITAGDSSYIGRPQEVGLECVWHTLAGDSVGVGGGIWVKPMQTTTYVVAQTLCGVVRNDTVTVYVWQTGVGQITINSEQVTVSPNPASREININAGIADNETVNMSMYDIRGREVMKRELRFKNNNAKMPLELQSGVYILMLQDGYGGRCVKRVVVR